MIKIHGKDYMEVNERVKLFRQKHPNGQIITNIESMDDEKVVMVCKIKVDDITLATGYAMETVSKNGVNSTSHLENCETSCVGRAIAFATAIGIEDSIASANEVQTAINQQNNSNNKNDDYQNATINFGKHKGTKWIDVDAGYLKWVIQNMENREYINYAQNELDRRDNAFKSITQNHNKELLEV